MCRQPFGVRSKTMCACWMHCEALRRSELSRATMRSIRLRCKAMCSKKLHSKSVKLMLNDLWSMEEQLLLSTTIVIREINRRMIATP